VGGVDAEHEFAVRGLGGVEILGAFGELQAQVSGLLFEVDDALLELVDVGGRAEPGGPPGGVSEEFGQAFLELVDADGLPGGAVLGGQQVDAPRVFRTAL